MLTIETYFKDLVSDKPISVLRCGNVEVTCLLQEPKQISEVYSQMFTNAGFYGSYDDYIAWEVEYMNALRNMDYFLDVVSCSSFVICGELLIKNNIYCNMLPYIENIDHWINLLLYLKKHNKKICIVSFFAKEMKQQYKIIDKIFEKHNLTNIDIEFVETPSTIKGNDLHTGWKETYEDIKSKLGKSNSDIYLLSCGCYGLPLCNFIKTNLKKTSIYAGALLQMLFGLKGKRWDERELMNKYYNSYWKYPNRKPKNFSVVENGCYWGQEQQSEKP